MTARDAAALREAAQTLLAIAEDAADRPAEVRVQRFNDHRLTPGRAWRLDDVTRIEVRVAGPIVQWPGEGTAEG